MSMSIKVLLEFNDILVWLLMNFCTFSMLQVYIEKYTHMSINVEIMKENW